MPKTVGRIAYRLYPEQTRMLERAMLKHPEAWRGVAWFAREAAVKWAADFLAQVAPSVADEKHTRKTAPRKRRKAA